MANHLKRRQRGSCTVRFFIFPLQFFQKMAKRGKVNFTFLKYAKNSAYFEPRLTILRHKWTIWQSFLWLLSDMAGHLKRRQRGSCAARFFVFPLHFLQEMAKGAKLFLPFWNLQRILLILSPGWPFWGKYWPFGSHFFVIAVRHDWTPKKEAEWQLCGPVFHLPTAFSQNNH